MRILHLNPFYFPYAGGIERRIQEVARRHAVKHDVTILTSQLEGTVPEERIEGVRIVRLPSKYRLERFYNPPIVTTPGLDEAIREIAPDVIDYHSRWAPSYAKAYQHAATGRVFTYHNTYGEGSGPLGLLSRLNDRWTRRYIAKSHRIVCVSRFIWDDLKHHGFPADRFALVPNGVDPEALRRMVGVPPRDASTTLVAVGRVVRLKGFDTLIRALPDLDPSIHVRICGEGPERARLSRLAQRLGVADRVDLPGWVDEATKLALLSNCLAFVHPARFEAFGMAPLEAMAMGAPVVATDVGGLPEVVDDAGILVPPDRPKALAAAVQRLIDEPELRKRFRPNAETQCATYHWDRIAEQLLPVYEEARRIAKV